MSELKKGLKRILTEGLPTKSIKRNYTTLVIEKEDSFVELACDKNFNPSSGSLLADDQKEYFFNGLICYMHFKNGGDFNQR